MQSKLMNKYFKHSPNVEPVTEGWGSVAAWFFFNWVGYLGAFIFSEANVRKLMHEKSIQKYIADESKKIFNKEQKAHKDLQKKLPKGIKAAIKEMMARRTEYSFLNAIKNFPFGYELMGWNILVWGDTDHIEKVVLTLYSPSEDRYICRALPAPTKNDLKRLGFREED